MLEDVRSLMAERKMREAERTCRELLNIQPRNAEAIYWLASMAARVNRYDESVDLLRQAIALERNPVFYSALAKTLKQADRATEAREVIESLVKMAPDWAEAHAMRGDILNVLGHQEEARESYERTIELNPRMGGAYNGLAMLRTFEPDDGRIAHMERSYADESIPEQGRTAFAFALGRVYHDLKQYDRAFEFYHEGNKRKRGELNYDLERERENAKLLIDFFDRGFFERMEGVGSDSEVPVLIVGMPRSGSTLTEQILHAHPDVYGAGELMDLSRTIRTELGRYMPEGGELPRDIEQVTREGWQAVGDLYAGRLLEREPSAKRVTDKQLFNYTMVPLVHLLLPRARIIHCVRDPMDNCLSMYMANFENARNFMYDMDELGQTYTIYRRMMDHWDEVLPGRIHTVVYEDMVEDVEAGARALIDYLGLPWDDRCLEFYKADRTVRTMSASQVRKPIYSSSVGRWRNYAKHLEPLREALEKPF